MFQQLGFQLLGFVRFQQYFEHFNEEFGIVSAESQHNREIQQTVSSVFARKLDLSCSKEVGDRDSQIFVKLEQ